MQFERCRRCRHYPTSPRIFGYCSWDCHDADGAEEEPEQDAPTEREEVPIAA